ncbi:MAG TPA: hypothetical protein VFL59_16865, partial [Candidatus Nanopelagicales bacterium]|nr:hypothetical protein [Candidatus Nanopelagicales bacterium]
VVETARDAGDRAAATALGKLRKPTVTAYLANRLVRMAPDVVAGVLAVGPAMREATVSGDADGLRDLGRHRAALLSDLGARARAIAEEDGVRMTATHQRELEATFTAAAADEQAAATLLTARITGPLESASMGFDLGVVPPERPAGGAASAPARPTESVSAAEREAQAERERMVVEAEQALAEARLQDADAEVALATAQDAFDAALAAESEAAEALRAAKQALSDARADLTAAKADATATGRAVAAALARLEKARPR